jgi:hypothetical protein
VLGEDAVAGFAVFNVGADFRPGGYEVRVTVKDLLADAAPNNTPKSHGEVVNPFAALWSGLCDAYSGPAHLRSFASRRKARGTHRPRF